MKPRHPDFSILSEEECAILFPASERKQQADETERRARARQRVIEAAEAEGFTIEEIFRFLRED